MAATQTIRQIRLGDVAVGMTLGRFAQWLPGGPQIGNLCSTAHVARVDTIDVAFVDGYRLRRPIREVVVSYTDGREYRGNPASAVWEVLPA